MELEFTLIYVFGILVIGYILSKIISRIIIKLVRTGRYVEPVERKETIQTIAEKVILVITFSIAILFFGVNSKDGMFLSFFDLVPTVVMIVLMFIMGSVIINLFMWFVKRFLEYIRTEEYFSRESRQFVLPVMIFVIQLILYLSLAHIIFSLVEIPVLQTILGFILYPVIILLFFLLAAGLINPMRDFFARVYLLNIMEFRPGTLIKIDEKEYVIKNVRGMYTELHEKTNGLVIMPNRVIASSTIGIVKPVKEMDTLQKLKDNYVAQSKSHCGPASASMALGIFGYHYTQEELGKLMGTIKRKKATGAAGTHPKSLIETVTRITEGQVVGAWISFDKISSLMKEINIWMRQGGLCIVDYKKKYLFP